ncbi:hypothetical protein Slin15195_G062340 [Septoria linicola]|uniref:Uncharacterized protein n=1 Tax=Septoria linicola TaxID=215465 RepID=A0A9Q9AUT1_9PEZI|nr:hypothetical protein Slin14017_G078150 [Septoria linicola]USW52915.1 hypothetical protein Slin15195_G062340 [Septoria linicola]
MVSLLLPVLLATAALASPPPAGYGYCATVNKKISAASEQSSATAYCSSYLSVPVYTSKVVRTTTTTTTKNGGKCTSTVTAPEITSVVTSTITSIADTVKFSTTTTVTDVVTSTPDATTVYTCQVPFKRPRDGPRRRDVQGSKPKKPKCLSSYTAKTAISSACSCVSVRPSTTTIATKTSTVTQTVTERRAKGGVTTTTPTKIVTSLVTEAKTVSTTTTLTERVTTTTAGPTQTVNAIQPPDGFAIGAWKEGSAYNGFYLITERGSTDPAIFYNQEGRDLTVFALQQGDRLRDLINYGYAAGAPDSPYQDPLAIGFLDRDADNGASCSVEVKDDFMCYVNCAIGDKTTNYICADGSWYIGTDSEAKPGCERFTPLAVFSQIQK